MTPEQQLYEEYGKACAERERLIETIDKRLRTPDCEFDDDALRDSDALNSIIDRCDLLYNAIKLNQSGMDALQAKLVATSDWSAICELKHKIT